MVRTERIKEVAKFVSGVTAWEAVVHGSLLLSGQSIVLFGITVTPSVNAVQTVVPALVALGLGIWAWTPPRVADMHRPRTSP